ncbi:hypothetical protein L6452_15153 [Arctium lappa]|uniref:Uncharacterized protein n=1 Tax=Arctium lappa TaxID=4217 RepID=A0ACB9CN16_ARCLA|nr:hypothetical protein L6452_15153 [Arctium lappa]
MLCFLLHRHSILVHNHRHSQMELDDFEPLLGEPKVEWSAASLVTTPIHPFLFQVDTQDSSSLGVNVTDFFSVRWTVAELVNVAILSYTIDAHTIAQDVERRKGKISCVLFEANLYKLCLALVHAHFSQTEKNFPLIFRYVFQTYMVQTIVERLNGVRLVDDGLRARFKAAFLEVEVQPQSPPSTRHGVGCKKSICRRS